MSEEPRDLAHWLALLRAPGIGAVTFQSLLTKFGTPYKILEIPLTELSALEPSLSTAALSYLQDPDWKAVDNDLAWSAHPEHHILTLHDPSYPSQLREIDGAPPLLFVHGNLSLLSRPQIAIVGSRNPTPIGEETTESFARHLSSEGLVITSGLALGIDAASHRGALRQTGPTIAVAGTGLDRVYPACHRELAHEIAANGALVSELPIGTSVSRRNFPRRNRILSGLSLGTLITEATDRSGSLITARLAAEQNREVFAIPGSIHNPLSRGCHLLIRQGAKLVEKVQDILEELAPLLPSSSITEPTVSPSSPSEAPWDRLSPEAVKLLECLGFDPASVDTLVERSGLTAETVSSMLLTLELQGHVVPVAGGLYLRAPNRS